MLIFEHVPKTGGATFHRSYLPWAFPPEELFAVHAETVRDIEARREQFRNMTHKQRSRLRVASGHQMEFIREIEPQATFFTIARDPVQRLISSYIFSLYHADMQPWREQMISLPSLAEYATYDPNLQSAILLGSRDLTDIGNRGRYNSLTDEEIEQQIGSRYAVVGVTEEYNRLMFYLHRRLGVPLCLFNKRLVGQERSSLPIDPPDIEKIRYHNSMDVRLYEIVSRMFESKFSDVMTPLDWDIFDLYERCLNAFRAMTDNDENSSICLTTGPVSLLLLTSYYDLLQNILSGKANYSDLVTKAAWWSRNGLKITPTLSGMTTTFLTSDKYSPPAGGSPLGSERADF
jgi:hypothetical protein